MCCLQFSSRQCSHVKGNRWTAKLATASSSRSWMRTQSSLKDCRRRPPAIQSSSGRHKIFRMWTEWKKFHNSQIFCVNRPIIRFRTSASITHRLVNLITHRWALALWTRKRGLCMKEYKLWAQTHSTKWKSPFQEKKPWSFRRLRWGVETNATWLRSVHSWWGMSWSSLRRISSRWLAICKHRTTVLSCWTHVFNKITALTKIKRPKLKKSLLEKRTQTRLWIILRWRRTPYFQNHSNNQRV